MSTTSSIGAGKTYSDPDAWLTAFAAGGWIGEIYNTAEFTRTTTLAFSGQATSAADFIRLTTAAGESFRDNANVQTNALRYNQANGVGIRKTSAYNPAVSVAESYVTLSKLQIAHTGGGGGDSAYVCGTGLLSGVLVDSCIEESNSASTSTSYVHTQRSGGVINTVIVNRGTNGNGLEFDYASGTPYAVNCTIVRTQTAAGIALHAATGAWTVKNCAIFGFTTLNSGGTATSCSNNCSDLAIGFGTSNQASKTFANQFQNITDATRDFRAKAVADILDTGVTDTTNVPSAADIVGTARPQGTAWDIGAWELVAASGSTFIWFGNLNQGQSQPLNEPVIRVAA